MLRPNEMFTENSGTYDPEDIQPNLDLNSKPGKERREFRMTELVERTHLQPTTIKSHINKGHFGVHVDKLPKLPDGEERFILRGDAIEFFLTEGWRVERTTVIKVTEPTRDDKDTRNYFYIPTYSPEDARAEAHRHARIKLKNWLDILWKMGKDATKEERKEKYTKNYLSYYQSILTHVKKVKKNKKPEWEITQEVVVPFDLLGDIAMHYSSEQREYFSMEYVSYAETYSIEDPIQRFTIMSAIDEQIRQQAIRKKILGLHDYVDKDLEDALTASTNRWRYLIDRLEKRSEKKEKASAKEDDKETEEAVSMFKPGQMK